MSVEAKDPVVQLSETGWDRVKALFVIRHGDKIPEELMDVSTTMLIASLTGFLFGGLLGARHAGDKYILMNHSTKYTSTMQAQRELHGAAMLGFARKGTRWGWRMAVFAGIFSGSHALLSVYRDRDDALNYVAAGALTGGLFRLRAGLKPTIGGMVLGILVSLPVGVVMHGLDRLLVSAEQREEVRRERYQDRRRREEEWRVKLNSTSVLIQDIEGGLTSGGPVTGGGLQTYYTLGNNDQTLQKGPERNSHQKNVDSGSREKQSSSSAGRDQ